MAGEEGAFMKAWNQGRDEIAALNRGDLAMGAPPIQAEAPQVDYNAALEAAAARAPEPVSQEQQMER